MANQQPDYTYGLRSKLKDQGIELYPGMSDEDSFKTFVNNHYQNLKSDSFPDGLVVGGTFYTEEKYRSPGPKEGFPGPPTGGTYQEKNTIEDVKFEDGPDKVPEISKITFVKPNGTRMVYDARAQTIGYNNVAKPIKPGHSLNEEAAAREKAINYLPENPGVGDHINRLARKGASTVADAFSWAVGPTGINDQIPPVFDSTGIDNTEAGGKAKSYSTNWLPGENQSYQETGITPPGRSLEDLNAVGYQPWVDRSTLINQAAAGDYGMIGKLNIPANLVRNIIDISQNHPNQPDAGVAPGAFAFSPNNVLKPGELPYSTNKQSGAGYQNMAEHRLLMPLEDSQGDSNAIGLAKGFANLAPAAVNFGSGLAEFITSPLGLFTLGAGKVAAGRQGAVAGAMEESQAARDALNAAKGSADKQVLVKTLADALSNEAKYANQARIASTADFMLQGNFIKDMLHGTKQGFEDFASSLQQPVYNKELDGYVGNRANYPAAGTHALETLGNVMFTTQIGSGMYGHATDIVHPRVGAYKNYIDPITEPRPYTNTPFVGGRGNTDYDPNNPKPLNLRLPPEAAGIPQENVGDAMSAAIQASRARRNIEQRRREQEVKDAGFPTDSFYESKPFVIPKEIIDEIRNDHSNDIAGGTGRARGRGRFDAEPGKEKQGGRPGETAEKGAQTYKPGDVPMPEPIKVEDPLAPKVEDQLATKNESVDKVAPETAIPGIPESRTIGEVPPSEPIQAPIEPLSIKQTTDPKVVKEASDRLNRVLDAVDRDKALFQSGIEDGSYSRELGMALIARADRQAIDGRKQFERDISPKPGERILAPNTDVQNVRNYQVPETTKPGQVKVPSLPSGALEAAADSTKMSVSGQTKPQFADRGIESLNGKQAFDKNSGNLRMLTFEQLKDLRDTTTADPAHNPKFVSKISEEMASRERMVADTYSPEQSGKNAITDNLKPELISDAQLKDITDNHPARIEAQKKIVAGHNRGDYKSPLGKRSQEGEQAVRELNKLKYQLSFARSEANKRVRAAAGIARPTDGSRIVASQKAAMSESRIDPTTGEKIEQPKAKRDPVTTINNLRGRLDKASLDELYAARDALRSQGRDYWKKIDEHIQGRNLESERVHRREYGSKATSMPNARIIPRAQLEQRISELPDEIKAAETQYEQTKSPEDLKTVNEAKGDLSAFRRELNHRDTMEAADVSYESNTNVKQVSGDIQGVPSKPAHPTPKGPFKRDVSEPPAPEPIEGRSPERIRAEGAAAYEQEQQREANTPKNTDINFNQTDNKAPSKIASRKDFVKNEADFAGLSGGRQDIAYKIAEGQSTVEDILRKVSEASSTDKSINQYEAKIAQILLKSADKKSLSRIAILNRDKYASSSMYQTGISGMDVAAARAGTGSIDRTSEGIKTLRGNLVFSRGMMMDNAEMLPTILHEILHTTTADKVNRAIFGTTQSFQTGDNSVGEAGQKYLDRLKAYAKASDSDKAIVKVVRSYLKYLSQIKDNKEGLQPISWDKINNDTSKAGETIGNTPSYEIPRQAEAGQYKVRDIHEFITHAMTDKDFQNELRTIKMGNRSVWEVIKQSVAEMLGIAEGDTALAHTLDGIMEISRKDLSEFDKPGWNYYSSLIDVRAERFMDEGMTKDEAMNRATNEFAGEDAFGAQKIESAGNYVQSIKDIEADIEYAQKNGESQAKIEELKSERDEFERVATESLKNNPMYQDAVDKLGENATHDEIVQEIHHQELVKKGEYDQRNNPAERKKYFENSKKTEEQLSNEVMSKREQQSLERQKGMMRSELAGDAEAFSSLPAEDKARTDINAISSMDYLMDDSRTLERIGYKEKVLEEYGVNGNDVKGLREDPDMKAYFMELDHNVKVKLGQNGEIVSITKPDGTKTTTKELGYKGDEVKQEDSYNEDNGFDQQDFLSPSKQKPIISFNQTSNKSLGRFGKEELQAGINRAEEIVDGYNQLKPNSIKDVVRFGMDVTTISLLRASSAQLDVIADRNNIPAVKTIRKLLMGNNAGEMDAAHAEGFHTSVSAQNLIFKNRVNEILRPFEKDMKLFSNKAQREKYEAIGRAIVQQRPHPDPEIAKAVTEFRKLFKELYDYQTKAGIKMSTWGDTYVPRILSVDRVLKNRDAFVEAATKAYKQSGLSAEEALKAAEEWHHNILMGDEGLAVSGTKFIFDSSSYNGEPKHTRNRVFSADAERAMEPFYNRNIMDATQAYIGRAVKSSELARRFGANFEKYIEFEREIIKTGPKGENVLREVNWLVEGQIAPQKLKHPFWRSAADLNTLYQSVRFLTNATISSASEPLLNSMRTGNMKDGITAMGDSFKYGFRNAARISADYHTKLAEDIGVVQSILSSSAFSTSVDSRYLDASSSRIARAGTNAFFRGTGLAQWTEGTRIASVRIGEVFLARLGQDIADGGKAAQMSSRLLNELGVTGHKEMSRFIAKIKTMDPEMRLRAIGNMNSKVAAEYRSALRKYTEQVIMNPNRGTNMKYANHPLGFVINGLQSYQSAFTENVIKRQMRILGNEVVMNKGKLPFTHQMLMLAPLMMTPIYIAANFGQGIFRDEAMQDPNRADDPPATPGVKTMRALSRSGMLARAELPLNTYAGFKYKKDPATALLGPTLSDTSTTAVEIAKLFVPENTDNTNTQERKTTRTLLNSVGQPVVSMFATTWPGATGRVLSTFAHYGAKHPATREYFVEKIAGPPVDKRADEQRMQDARNILDDYIFDTPQQ